MSEQLKNLEVKHIGQDSEFFLWDTRKQEVVPSYLYYRPQAETPDINGYLKRFKKRYTKTKINAWTGKVDYNVYPAVSSVGLRYKAFRDGLAVEFNTTPVSCRAYLWNGLRAAMLKGEPSRMPSWMVFTTRPWVKITEKMMEKFPADLRELGCMPSLDAYKQREKRIAVDPMKTLFRTSGAHFHCSWWGYDKENPIPPVYWTPIIRAADQLMGLPHVIMFGDELERKRRKLYGQAGEFRAQSYGGLEYRVLSSRVWNHQGIYSFLSGMWKYMVCALPAEHSKVLDPAMDSEVQQAINEVNVELACSLVDKIFPKLRSHFQKGWTEPAGNYRYDYSPKAPSSSSDLNAFKAIREHFLAGRIPDAGIWSRPWAPDGHQGWHEYRETLLSPNYTDRYGLD